MINGSICWECKKWHSHVYPHPLKQNKNICINCLNERRRGRGIKIEKQKILK